ncbi:hypothetical protein BOX15_Mlig030333g3, partial [Macrostomum lignano]
QCTDPELIAALPGLQVSSPGPNQIVLSAPGPHLLVLLQSASASDQASVSFIPLAQNGITPIGLIDDGEESLAPTTNTDNALFNVRIESAGAWAELSANKTSLFVNWQPVTEDRPALLQPGAFIACSGCLYMFSWDQALPRCQRALLGNLCLLKDQPDPTSLRREAALLAQQVDRLSSAAERRNHLAVRVAEAFDILEAAQASRQCRNPIQNLPALPVPVAKGLLCASVSLPGLRIGSALAVPNAMRGCAAVTVVPDCRRQQPEGPASCIRLSAAPRLRYAASAFVENLDNFQADSEIDFSDKLKNNANLVTMATERQLALLASVGQQLADMLSKLNEPVAMETGCNLCQQLFDPLCDLAKALLDGRSLLTDAAVLTVPNNDSSESAC